MMRMRMLLPMPNGDEEEDEVDDDDNVDQAELLLGRVLATNGRAGPAWGAPCL